ncbi:MAG: thioredoxin family protein [Candidatus Omnitrophica bacterium]|nr:thioredoxin family protein [Candidatus Omnitrophota bacterium]
MKKYFILSLLFLCAGILPQSSSRAQEKVTSANTTVQLISEVASIKSGQPFWVGLHMEMDPHWHTYWVNPGDSGLSPKLQWALPDGFTASEIVWPFPVIISEAGLTTYGFEDENLLFVKITPPMGLDPTQMVSLQAKAIWLACKEICLPGEAQVSLTLPVKEAFPQSHPEWGTVFDMFRPKLPVATHPYETKVYEDTDHFYLVILSQEEMTTLSFFSLYEDVIQYAAPQFLEPVKGGYQLTLKKSEYYEQPVAELRGVLVNNSGWGGLKGYQAFELSREVLPYDANKFTQMYSWPIPMSPSGSASGMTIWVAICFALLGGLILNLMPCVLPVLSIKVLGLIEHAQDKQKAFKNGLIFMLGVLVSFWVLAGILMALRSIGQQIGWGFQFQTPGFVVFMAVLLYVFGLNLFGLFEVGTSLTSISGKVKPSSGASASFLSGVLTTIVATPCTAPFMGTALGFALSQPAMISLIIFTALGIGLSLPYVILSGNAKLLKFVPKPGPWMVHLKSFLGFILMASVVWLLWVLGAQLGTTAMTILMIALLFISVGMWVYGIIQRRHKAGLAVIWMGLFLLGGGLLAGESLRQMPVTDQAEQASREGIQWRDFTQTDIAQVRKEGGMVFLDFTAKWCLSCQVNERVVFQNDEVIQYFRDRKIVPVKADWTNYDESITRALAAFGKNSIPLYVVYPADISKEPIILPEVITPKIVLEALKNI